MYKTPLNYSSQSLHFSLTNLVIIVPLTLFHLSITMKVVRYNKWSTK
jgi:hypothetical protein